MLLSGKANLTLLIGEERWNKRHAFQYSPNLQTSVSGFVLCCLLKTVRGGDEVDISIKRARQAASGIEQEMVEPITEQGGIASARPPSYQIRALPESLVRLGFEEVSTK